MNTKRRRIGVLAILFLALLGGSAAVASWLVDGTGPGSAKAATVAELGVSAGTPTASLYPGATGDLAARVSNPNPFPVMLTGATFGAVTVTPVDGRTCTAADVAVSGPVSLSGITLPANSGTDVTVPGALTMLTTAADGCQGATFTVEVTLSGASA
ncbi:hypothetical protein ACI792_19005 [Blastococcus sp. SYSU DS0669]